MKKNKIYVFYATLILFLLIFTFSLFAFQNILNDLSFLKISIISISIVFILLISYNLQKRINSKFTLKLYNLILLLYSYLLILFITDIFFNFINLIFKISLEKLSLFVFIFATILTTIFYLNAISYEIKKIKIYSKKIKKDIKFVQLSDIHLFGKYSINRFNLIFKKAIKLKPNFIIITGDLFDKPGEVSLKVLNIINNYKIPVLIIYGNHDVMYGLDKIEKIIKNTKAILLDDKELFYKKYNLKFIGLTNRFLEKDMIKALSKFKINNLEYTILLYHTPHGIKAVENKKIDLMLSGHTHGGQVFPINFIVKKVYKYFKGLYNIGNLKLYINQGTGLWGPQLRTFSKNEITLIEIKKIEEK